MEEPSPSECAAGAAADLGRGDVRVERERVEGKSAKETDLGCLDLAPASSCFGAMKEEARRKVRSGGTMTGGGFGSSSSTWGTPDGSSLG